MDKKKKLIPAVCLVLVCGVVYLGIHYGGQREDRIVLEKVSQEEEGPGAVEEKSDIGDGSDLYETAGTQVSGAPEEEKLLYVHVCGAVVTEGVYTLPDGSRVSDGIIAAGGFADRADTAYHNLAARLTDGQKVYVPTLEETSKLSVPERMLSEENVENSGEPSEVTTSSKKVNLNTAGQEELMTLNGIGESKAKSILQYREKVGPFQSIEELKKVSGIGDAMFERVKDDIVVE